MTPLSLELVIDLAQPAQQTIATRLREGLRPGEELRVVPRQHWLPGLCRNPGASGSAAVCVLLAAAGWQPGQGGAADLPAAVLMLTEHVDGRALEIGPATGLMASARGEPASHFLIGRPFVSQRSAELLGLVQLTVPSLARWRFHQQRCLRGAADYLLWWLRLCDQRQALLTITPLAHRLPLQPALPMSRRLQLGASGRWALAGTRRRIGQRFAGEAQPWRVGIGQLEPGGQRLQVLHELPPCGTDWFADPFLVRDGPNTWLFCERWDGAEGRGVIDLFCVRSCGLEACGTVIAEPFHLSFPRVVQHSGAWFATVESGSNSDVRLYRALAFPHRWRLERQLLSGEAWIDPILIPSSAGWWLLVNTHHCPALPASSAAELHLFHSPDLLEGQFTPHPGSPLRVDSTCGRNGGLLHLEGELLRVGQGTGIDNAYGQGIQLYRIDQMDKGHYRETTHELAWLRKLPRDLRASHLHTLNNAGPWMAVDYRTHRRGF